jgi:DtxR family Mn-dependent transcriptional regulator
MINPATALLSALVFLATLVIVFWPDRGLFWRLRRAFQASERVQAEDALKHLFDCEYKGRIANLQSLSGTLSISGNRAAEILSELESEELVTPTDTGYTLTSEGRSYALRVVRTHRLWERYLSDETGLEPQAWHQEAELREHTLSERETEQLAASMGHPRFDPHGDPIPTASGDIAPPQGRPLPQLPIGKIAEIVHVEDEPDAVYAQIVAEGLHPGMRVRVNEISPQRIRFEANAEEYVLAPIVADNLSVVPLAEEVEMEGPYERLSALDIGDRAKVIAISPSLRPRERRRMLDLGLVPGTEVTAEIRSPSGDPTGYRIRGAVIALRSDQAVQIQIERAS